MGSVREVKLTNIGMGMLRWAHYIEVGVLYRGGRTILRWAYYTEVGVLY